jgi:GNAT superfamily N-acetyltransferase
MKEDLRRRVVAGLDPEISLFGGSSEDGSVLRLPGVIAGLCPSTPDRSLFNSVLAIGAGALAAAYEELAAAYEEAGVRAWTVWVPDDDRETAALLSERGHLLDGAPRSMALELSELRRPERPPPPGAELVPASMSDVAAINDAAYGLAEGGWSAAVDRFAPGLSIHTTMAVLDGEPVSCAIVIDSGDDACVSAVATLPEQQGKGLAPTILTELLEDARDRGLRTGSLQASKAGAPVYERLGFTDVGFIEMWERRTA